MIQISDTLRIKKLDKRALSLEVYAPIEIKENKKKTGEIRYEWQIVGYYGKLEEAFGGVLKYKLFNTAEEELTIKQLIERITNIENEIKEMVKAK